MGIRGSRKEAVLLREEIRELLKRIKLELSKEKTVITHASRGRIKFLGVVIRKTGSYMATPRLTVRVKGPKRRIGGGQISMRAPETNLIKKLIENGFMLEGDKG